MPEFLRLLPPQEALERWQSHLPPAAPVRTEVIPTEAALGRVLAEPATASEPLPAFARSTVDGYAVRAADTYGASAALPAYLTLAGEVPMGGAPGFRLGAAQAALVHTGGMVPEGADAVVMVEDTQAVRGDEVEVLRPLAVGQNVIPIGEDVQAGQVVIHAGQLLRPQEIGGLMALGIRQITVAGRPRVAILSTGDEVVAPEQHPTPGQVRDVNSYTLAALVEAAGGQGYRLGIFPDQFEALLSAAQKTHAESDVVLVTAGSSVSTRDLTARVIERLGPPGVVVHGVAIKPGKPTILAVCQGIPVVGLPGNPVSALVIARVFVVPLLRRLLGQTEDRPQPSARARLTTNVASETGREDYQPVRLVPGGDGWQAEPIYGRSNLIFTLSRADGLVRIPPEATGLPAGAEVDVLLF